MPAIFAVLPSSIYDYNFTSVNDNYTAQNLQNSHIQLQQGRMLGGTTASNHMIYLQGAANDYNQWAKILNDDSWNYTNVSPYFKRLENLTDPELLVSPYAKLHGTDGMLKITRQKSDSNANYLKAFKELGHRIVDDITSETSFLGYTEPLLTLGDGVRETNGIAYLGPAMLRSNICLSTSTTATKVLIENGTAKGVQVTTSSGETQELYAKKEVIVSAGGINSPKLLMLSGIGPKEHLESLRILVVTDLPVGQNLTDHYLAIMLIQMEESHGPVPSVNPYQFPLPITTGYVALNKSQTYPDYQAINLVLPHDSPALMQVCVNVFKYTDDICNRFYAASINRTTFFSAPNLLMPKSRGKVLLASSDPTIAPLIYTGMYSNKSDLKLMGECLADLASVLNTTYFRSVNATLVDMGLCSGKSGIEFWECYALGMSGSMWHYAGTCAMGSVVDTSMRVKGVKGLRVVDASVMPAQVSGNINGAVTMIAERAAELILQAWNISVD